MEHRHGTWGGEVLGGSGRFLEEDAWRTDMTIGPHDMHMAPAQHHAMPCHATAPTCSGHLATSTGWAGVRGTPARGRG